MSTSTAPPLEQLIRDRVASQLSGALTDVDPFENGRSGHNFGATLVTDVSRAVVLRAGSPGRPPEGRHDMRRMGRVMQALAATDGVAVPEVINVLDGDPQILVMSRVPGECCEPAMDGCEHLSPQVVDRRARAAARMLAALHAAPAHSLFPDVTPATVEDELDRWARVLHACDPDLVPGGDELFERLRATVPTEGDPVLVHGDYRLGNLLCDDHGIRGIIDWEIWTLTDARIDLGWFLLFTDPEDWPGVAGPMIGMPTAADLQAEYEALAGTQSDVAWFLCFARLKMAAITAHNLKRHRTGRRHDPTQERFPRMIVRMLERGLEEMR